MRGAVEAPAAAAADPVEIVSGSATGDGLVTPFLRSVIRASAGSIELVMEADVYRDKPGAPALAFLSVEQLSGGGFYVTALELDLLIRQLQALRDCALREGILPPPPRPMLRRRSEIVQ